MSRIGNRPVSIPSGVTVTVGEGVVEVKGPKGTLAERIPEEIAVQVEGNAVRFVRPDDRKPSRAKHGLVRALVANMVNGVTRQFARELEIQGVGYRAEAQGKKLTLNVGYSHPVVMSVPDGIKVTVERNVAIRIEGPDRHAVGQFAANVRAVRPPEPYKGKGIRYSDEKVSLKETKKK